MLVALLVAGAVLPAHGRPPELADADLLYCARAYAEGALLLKADPGAGVRRLARDAQGRAQVLAAAASDLRTADAGRHQQASDLAGQRLAAMPAMPPEARRLALRAAYAECRYLEAGKGRTAATAVAAESAVAGKDSPATPAASTPITPALAPTPAMLAAATSTATAAGAASVSAVAPARALLATPATVSPTAAAEAASTVVPSGKSAAAAVTAPAAMTPTPSTATASRKEAAPAAAKMPAGSSPAQTAVPAAARPPLPSSPTAPGAAAGGLGDTDLLYCAQVYAETASMLEGETNADLRRLATDALQRSRALTERDADLLNEHPARHSRARVAARQRLAALPEPPGRGRSVALRGAYDECLALEARAATATAPSAPSAAAGDRVQMLARRHFCRDLLLSKLKVSAKLRAALSPSEQAALDETRRIGEALAQPLEGAPLTLEQDREANRLMAKFREELDLATANWRGGTDPVVQALGQCSDDYAQGLLGGPDVLAPDEAATPVAEPAVAEPVAAKAAVVQPADLGAVFHMRETTPAGTVDGLWFRRGRSNVYDAIWVQSGNGQVQRDVLELRGIVDGELTVYRQGFRGSYRARVRADGTLAPGTATWFDSAAYAWGPLPSQPVRGADLGAIVHMREVTPRGNYEGLWRQRGDTGVYDVLWVFLPTGEVSADVLAVTGVARGNLVIRRVDGPCLYPVARRAVALRAGGVPPLSKWVVLPPQALRLRNTSR